MEKMKKKEILSFLNKVRGHLCAYSIGPIKPASFCDCKYGADKIGSIHESGNGCPEMRNVINFIENLSDKNFK